MFTFTITHIPDDPPTKSGKRKVLLNCDAVDKAITLSTLLDFSAFGPMGVRKFDRIVCATPKFEAVERDYIDAEGKTVALLKHRQTVWLNGKLEVLNPTPMEPTVVVDRRTPEAVVDAF